MKWLLWLVGVKEVVGVLCGCEWVCWVCGL